MFRPGADAQLVPNAFRIVLETDPIAIASRVSRPRPDATVNLADIQLNEQSIMQVRSAGEVLRCSRALF